MQNTPALIFLVKGRKNIDIILVRGNNEGEYVFLEHSPVPKVIEQFKVVTAYNVRRLAHFAFSYAVENKRTKLTLVNNLEDSGLCEYLFSDTVIEVSKMYPAIKCEVKTVKNTVQNVLKAPESLDMILCEGMVGAMIISILHGIIGSEHLVSLSHSSERYAVFQPSGRKRGTSMVGKGVANPTGYILAGIDALEAVGAKNHSNYIKNALFDTFKENVRTGDIGGKATTKEFITALIENLKYRAPTVVCKYDYPQKPINPEGVYIFPE